MSWKNIYEVWKSEVNLAKNLKDELNSLAGNEEVLEDAFYAPLEFGTAGMRGIIGVGINRMNIYTVRQATEGLARLIEEKDAQAKKRGVVIAYDSRHFSQDFAFEAAKVLALHEINSFVFESLRPTPELSFAVREKQAIAGIMITASHNPAKYNGYKIYGEDGGQMPPLDADILTKHVRAIKNPLEIPVADKDEALDKGLITIVGEELDQKYLALVKEVTLDADLVNEFGRDLKLVYTPLNGTGEMLGRRALKQAGFTCVEVVKEQAIPDGDFSTLEVPNPEVPSAFNLAIELGKKVSADVLIATDPDADRLGVAVRQTNGDYQLLSGNQIGALMAKYILTAHQKNKTLPEKAVVIKSIVSTELVTEIAKSYHVPTLNVLTGFKFIAEKIKEFEQTHEHNFLFGFEESFGYLIKPFVRDKDAIQALLLIAEVAAFYKKANQTLAQGLAEIFKEYGYYDEKTISVTMDGIDGHKKQTALMEKLRDASPKEFAGIKVNVTQDFKTGLQTDENGQTSPLNMPESDVLKYILADKSWIAIRPSGTEPKVKFYLATNATSKAEANEKIQKMANEIKQITQM